MKTYLYVGHKPLATHKVGSHNNRQKTAFPKFSVENDLPYSVVGAFLIVKNN